MSEEVRQRLKAGEELPVGSMKIPMVDLPLGATEDRVCGTIDIEKALTEGERALVINVAADKLRRKQVLTDCGVALVL
jgi:Mg-chelatase subunit ChlI